MNLADKITDFYYRRITLQECSHLYKECQDEKSLGDEKETFCFDKRETFKRGYCIRDFFAW